VKDDHDEDLLVDVISSDREGGTTGTKLPAPNARFENYYIAGAELRLVIRVADPDEFRRNQWKINVFIS